MASVTRVLCAGRRIIAAAPHNFLHNRLHPTILRSGPVQLACFRHRSHCISSVQPSVRLGSRGDSTTRAHAVRFSTGTDTKGDTQEVDTASTDAATADETEAEAATPENVDVPALVTELETRRADIKELEQKNLDLNNQLLRSLAEQENVRSIARRDVENTRKFGIQKFALELLEVSDNLKRAAECVPIEFRTRPEGDDDPSELVKSMVSLYEGVSRTERVMLTTLGKFGLPGSLRSVAGPA